MTKRNLEKEKPKLEMYRKFLRCLEFDLAERIDTNATIAKMNTEEQLRSIQMQVEQLEFVCKTAEEQLERGVLVRDEVIDVKKEVEEDLIR